MEIRALRGWRYCASQQVYIGKYIAPPYDVLSSADRRQLLAGCDQNIVAVDLPHVPPKEVGPDSEYAAAATLLEQWKRTGVLCQEDKPAIYVYQQVFDLGPNAFS